MSVVAALEFPVVALPEWRVANTTTTVPAADDSGKLDESEDLPGPAARALVTLRAESAPPPAPPPGGSSKSRPPAHGAPPG